MSKPVLTPVTPVVPVKIPKGGANLSNIPVAKIKIKRGHNPRTDAESLAALDELKASISKHGLLTPILVAPTSEGADTYYVIAGERRFAAIRELGKEHIPAVIRTDAPAGSVDALILAVAENADGDDGSRKPMTLLDQARAFDRIANERGETDPAGVVTKRLGDRQIGALTGFSHAHVHRVLKLLAAPDKIQKMLAKGEISKLAAIAIADVPDDIQRRIMPSITTTTTEADVVRLVTDARRQQVATAKATAAAPVTAAASSTRHNVPVGQLPGTFSTARPMREVRKQIEVIAADYLNGVEQSDSVRADAAANRLAALLWVTGGMDTMDPKSRPFKAHVAELKTRLIDAAAAADADA